MANIAYNFLGSSGLRVSNLCLGTMTFGHKENGPKQCSEEEAHLILDRFAELGGNFIDTADVYQNGVSEQIVGNWLAKQDRKKFVIATKVRFEMGADPNNVGLSRGHIMDSIEASLKRLQTDYVDLYQIHCWDNAVPIEETLGALNDLVRCGKVRYLGASNLTGWQLQKIVDLSGERGWVSWVSLQQQYNMLCRHSELELVDVCQNEGIGFMPWSPLKGGWLSGKITREGSLESGSRIAWTSETSGRVNQSHPSFEQFGSDEKVWKLLDAMKDIADKHGKTVAQVALRWLLQKRVVSSVVIGVKSTTQLENNMGASTGWTLGEDQMRSLDMLSAYEVPYPYEMNWRANKARIRRS